ncbi:MULTISPECIES: RidA family protein [unclassified Roseitalea]|uniref:RidA family protein n=1 Tax=unclassified Roseitalea TaxID=2639107 RepID=UPI00273D71B8|nr:MULTISPECIES: RidA family protein [unclassified Roseitalea]
MLKLINQGARSNLPFSPGIIAGDVMFVSGQASVDRQDGHIITDTFEGEVRRSIENMSAILDAAGLSLDHVVNCRCYVQREEDVAEHNRIYAEYFPDPRPTRSTLVGVLGSRLKYEIDCFAYIHATRQQAEGG